MIDMHTHLLPNIDDGPRDWKEALALLAQGESDGILGAVCTSHVLNRLDEKLELSFIETFKELRFRAKQQALKISLWLGSEIHCQSVFNYKSRIATLNGNQKYLLFELPLNDIPSDVHEKVFELVLNGVTPILAHPERNMTIMRHPETAFELANRGMLMQMNAGSIIGVFGKHVKKVSEIMIDHRLVHFVGSDCHGGSMRPMLLSPAYKIISNQWGEDTAKILFHRNAALAIQGKKIPVDAVIPFEKKRKNRFFGFFK